MSDIGCELPTELPLEDALTLARKLRAGEIDGELLHAAYHVLGYALYVAGRMFASGHAAAGPARTMDEKALADALERACEERKRGGELEGADAPKEGDPKAAPALDWWSVALTILQIVETYIRNR